jgi:hypothetical protein
MRSYESGEILQKTILSRLKPFSGEYNTTRCEVRFAEEFDYAKTLALQHPDATQCVPLALMPVARA